jgi:hypothetical protein
MGKASCGATFWVPQFGRKILSPHPGRPPAQTEYAELLKLGPAQGPAYSELGGSFGVGFLTGIADLTHSPHSL